MTPPAISCEEAEALLPLVAEGSLDAERDPALFIHLGRCVQCQDSLARHDMVTLALHRGVPAPAPRLTRYRLPLPWAMATAAGVTVAAGLAWQAWPMSRRIASEPWSSPPMAMPSAGTSLVAVDPTPPPEPDTEVISVAGDDPQNPSYILVQNGQATLVRPAESAPRSSRPRNMHAVGLSRY